MDSSSTPTQSQEAAPRRYQWDLRGNALIPAGASNYGRGEIYVLASDYDALSKLRDLFWNENCEIKGKLDAAIRDRDEATAHREQNLAEANKQYARAEKAERRCEELVKLAGDLWEDYLKSSDRGYDPELEKRLAALHPSSAAPTKP